MVSSPPESELSWGTCPAESTVLFLAVVRVPVNRMRRVGICLGMLGVLLTAGLISISPASAQPDSVRAALLEEKGFSPDHSPRGALWRAGAVPGWGQFYNRQYYKMPFVYAGLAGGGYAIYTLTQRYRLFRRANLYVVGTNRAKENGGQNPYGEFEGDYNQAVARLGGDPESSSVGGGQLRDRRDQYRRWRDLSILGTGLFYALTVLDAYVSAHLLSFNVGGVALDVRPSGGERVLAGQRGRPGREVTGISPGCPDRVGVRVHVRF